MAKAAHQRDLLGQNIVDFDERVDTRRLRRERLARLQAQMAKANLGGMLLFDPVNIRYATGVRHPGCYAMRFFQDYILVPQEGKPVVFKSIEGAEEEHEFYREKKSIIWDYFPTGRNVEDAARRWAADIVDTMNDLGIAGEPLGFDRLDFYSMEGLRANEVQLADGRVPLEKARVIKTQDEVSLMRQACAIADVAICRVRDAIEPGVTENKLFSIMTATNLEFGGDHMDARLLTAGGNTNPWYRGSSDRIVRPGDLVAFDTDMAGPMGYFADFSRTYLCGDGKPSPQQLEAYKVAYNFIVEVLPLFKPGMSFQEIAEKAPPYPEEYKPGRYVVLAHGDGMSDEWPSIYFPDVSWSGYGNDPDVLEENMVISVEGLACKPGAREGVKLEEQILITADGYQDLCEAPYDERFL